MTTPSRIEELKRIAREATPGDWAEDVDGDDKDCVFSSDYGFGSLQEDDYVPAIVADCSRTYDMPDEMKQANARYIATFDPPTVLKLLDAYERMREALVEIEKARPDVEVPNSEDEDAVEKLEKINSVRRKIARNALAEAEKVWKE